MAKVEVKIQEKELYEEIEYIQSSANQWLELPPDIDTNSTNLYVDFQYLSTFSRFEFLYLINDSTLNPSSSDYYDALLAYNDGFVYSYNEDSNGGSFADSSTILNRYTLERNSNGVYINGTLNSNLQNTYVPSSQQSGIIKLLGSAGSDETRNTNKKLYRFKYGNSSGWKVDLIPCIRKSDQVIGMYDILNDVFYTNKGTGNFVAGSKTGNSYSGNSDNLYYTINRFNGLKSVESFNQSQPDAKSVYMGCLASNGSIEIVDSNGALAEKIKIGALQGSNLKTEIFANNNKIADHISSDSSYNVNDKVFKLNLMNKISLWDNIQYNGYKLNTQTTLYNILKSVMQTIGYTSIDAMLSYNLVDIKNYLQAIIIPYPYLKPDTFRNTIDKICKIGYLNCIVDNDGNIKFFPAFMDNSLYGPNIPKNKQLSEFNRDLVLNNIYKSVAVEYNQTNLADFNIIEKDIQMYEYSDITRKLQSYRNTLSDSSINSGLSVLYSHRPSANNPSAITGSFWYYNIVKFDISYDYNDIYTMTDFVPSIKYYITSIFPTGTIKIDTDTQYTTINNLTVYDSDTSDATIVSEWLNNNGEVPSGTPNFGFKIRDNGNGNFTVFAVLLYLITDKNTAYSTVSEDIINAIYNNVHIKVDGKKVDVTTVKPTSNYDLLITENELLQDGTTVQGNNVADFLKGRVEYLYSEGRISGTITICCADYYVGDTKWVDWEQGEIFHIGARIRIDKDNSGHSVLKDANSNDIYFKIIGLKFLYDGVPRLELQVIQLK